MNGLSYTQEYLALNSKGSIPIMNSNSIITCIVAGGLMELLESHIISINEKKKIVIERSLNENEMYLQPLYNTIKNSKPMTVKDIAGKYVFATSKRLNDFVEALSKPIRRNIM